MTSVGEQIDTAQFSLIHTHFMTLIEEQIETDTYSIYDLGRRKNWDSSIFFDTLSMWSW